MADQNCKLGNDPSSKPLPLTSFKSMTAKWRILFTFCENKVYNSNVLIDKAHCVFDVKSYSLLTLIVILSILNMNLGFILIVVVG